MMTQGSGWFVPSGAVLLTSVVLAAAGLIVVRFWD